MEKDSYKLMGRSQVAANSTRKEQGTSKGTGRYDPARTAFWRGSYQFKDAVSECLDIGGQ
jgi:hypothetical protein